MQDIVPIVIDIIKQYGYVMVFLGTIVGGELIILAAVFLASLGFLNIYLVILFGLLGIIISDNWWYFVGTKIRGKLDYFRKRFVSLKYHNKIESFGEKFIDHYPKFLILSKFVYGARIVTLLTSGYKHIPYRKFVKFNLIGSCSWIIIIVFLGYVMGVSWNYLAQYNESSKYYVLFGVLALFVIRYIFNKFIKLDDGQRN